MITQRTIDIAISSGDSDSLDHMVSIIGKHGLSETITNNLAQAELYQQIMPFMNQYAPDYEDQIGVLLKSVRQHFKDSPEHLLASLLIIQSINNYDDLSNHAVLYSDVLAFPQPSLLLDAWAGFSFTLSAPPDAPLHESRLLSRYHDGIANQILNNIYELVDSIDNGRGTPGSPIMFLAWHLFVSDQAKYLDIMSAKKDLFEIRDLLGRLDDHQKLIVATDTVNKLAKIECIREVVYFRNANRPFPENLYPPLAKAIISVANTDEQLFEQFLKYFLLYPIRSPFLFPALGLAISQLNEKQQLMVVDAILIELDHKDAALYNLLTQNLKLAAPSDVTLMVIKSIFQKRQIFLDEIDVPSIDEMKLTNVVNVAIEYLSLSPPNILCKYLESAITLLNEVPVHWHRTETEMNARQWLALSEVNVASLAFEAMGIDENDDLFLPILATLEMAVGQPLVMALMQHTQRSVLQTIINDIRRRFLLRPI